MGVKLPTPPIHPAAGRPRLPSARLGTGPRSQCHEGSQGGPGEIRGTKLAKWPSVLPRTEPSCPCASLQASKGKPPEQHTTCAAQVIREAAQSCSDIQPVKDGT